MRLERAQRLDRYQVVRPRPGRPGRPRYHRRDAAPPARPADAEAIRAIYNAEVTGSTATFDLAPAPWTSSGVDGRAPRRPPGPRGRRRRRHRVGFGSLSPYRDRPAYATTVENSVYVDDGHRGRGVGRALLDELVELATRHGFHTVVARVGGGNDASIGLHGPAGSSWSASSARSGASSAAGSTWPSSSACSDAAAGPDAPARPAARGPSRSRRCAARPPAGWSAGSDPAGPWSQAASGTVRTTSSHSRVGR